MDAVLRISLHDEAYASEVTMNSHVHVPDLVLNATQFWGVKLIVEGETKKVGGTSISAPTFAGADLVQKTKVQSNDLRKLIYKIGTHGFSDVVSGTSSSYSAHQGYDAATGWGIPDVTKLYSSLNAK